MHSRDKTKKRKEADGLPKQSKEAFEAIKAAISSRPVKNSSSKAFGISFADRPKAKSYRTIPKRRRARKTVS
jgi:hypothetical protein